MDWTSWIIILSVSGLVLFLIVLTFWHCGIWGATAALKGELYRSPRLLTSFLKRAILKNKIKTVINLSGGKIRKPWWHRQREMCRENGVCHYSVRLGAGRDTRKAAFLRLLQILDRCPKPILAHCSSGIDRTGLFVVFYLHLYKGVALEEAMRRQLNWRFGHFRFARPKIYAFFQGYQNHLKEHPETTLRVYLENIYIDTRPIEENEETWDDVEIE